MQSLKAKARGKLNLYLAVTGLLPDGYHSLETMYQSVDLGDDVSLSFHRRGGISLRSNLKYIPVDSRNVAVKAAELFFERTGISNSGLYINIKKIIPVGGGMAGGSTNAACVLKLLNRRYGSPLSEPELLSLGLDLGADVPFCITGGAMAAGGVGEQMTLAPPLPPCHLLICKPNVSVSTKKAFALFDRTGTLSKPGIDDFTAALEKGDLADICAKLHNDFEPVIFEEYPRIAGVKEHLIKNGAMGALMTGSGACVFGIFDSKESAKAAQIKMKQVCSTVFLTEPYSK